MGRRIRPHQSLEALHVCLFSLCTWTATHIDQEQSAVDRGLDVFCHKIRLSSECVVCSFVTRRNISRTVYWYSFHQQFCSFPRQIEIVLLFLSGFLLVIHSTDRKTEPWPDILHCGKAMDAQKVCPEEENLSAVIYLGFCAHGEMTLCGYLGCSPSNYFCLLWKSCVWTLHWKDGVEENHIWRTTNAQKDLNLLLRMWISSTLDFTFQRAHTSLTHRSERSRLDLPNLL